MALLQPLCNGENNATYTLSPLLSSPLLSSLIFSPFLFPSPPIWIQVQAKTLTSIACDGVDPQTLQPQRKTLSSSLSLPKGKVLHVGKRGFATQIGMGVSHFENPYRKVVECFVSHTFRAKVQKKDANVFLRVSDGQGVQPGPMVMEYQLSMPKVQKGTLYLRISAQGTKGLEGDFKIMLRSGEWTDTLNWSTGKRLVKKTIPGFHMGPTGLRVRILGKAQALCKGPGSLYARVRASVRFEVSKAAK